MLAENHIYKVHTNIVFAFILMKRVTVIFKKKRDEVFFLQFGNLSAIDSRQKTP